MRIIQFHTVTSITYTMRQKKGTYILLCASVNARQKLVSFLIYIKESISYDVQFRVFNFGMC